MWTTFKNRVIVEAIEVIIDMTDEGDTCRKIPSRDSDSDFP